MMENIENKNLGILEIIKLIDGDELNNYYYSNKDSIEYFCKNVVYENITNINDINQRQIISIIVKKLNSFLDIKYFDDFFNYINNIEDDYIEKINLCNSKEQLFDIIELLNWKEDILNCLNINNKSIDDFRNSNLYLLDLINTSLIHLIPSLTEEEFKKVENSINNNKTFELIINKHSVDYSIEDFEFLNNYISTIIKYDSIFNQKSLNENKLVYKFLNLELDDEYLILNLMKAIPKNYIIDILKSNESLLNSFDKYLNNFSIDESIKEIYMSALIKEKMDFNDFQIFYTDYLMDGNKEVIEKFSWLRSIDIQTKIKEYEEKLLNSYNVILEPTLIEKIINKYYNKESCYNSLFINIYQAVKSGNFYSPEETNRLLNLFYIKGANKYYELPDNFNLDDNIQRRNKSINAYLKGEIIDINLSKFLLKEQFLGKLNLGKFSTKAIVQSIIINYLKSMNIDIKSVYFYNDEKNAGISDNNNKIIYINNKLIDDFCDNKKTLLEKIRLFTTCFHEISHFIQNDSISNGKFNNNYYNLLKEKIIFDADESFYENNYSKLVTEIDADLSSYKKTVHFFEYIDESIAIEIQKEIMNMYIETLNFCKNQIERKRYIGSENFSLNMEDIISIIINKDISILKKYPILEIEYNFDGSKKSLIDSFVFVDKNCFDNISMYLNILKNLYIENRNLKKDTNIIFNHSFKRPELNKFIEDLKQIELEDINNNVIIVDEETKNTFRK